MLYGNKVFVDGLMREVNNVEAERNIKVIYGSTIGSISRGIQRYTSDYDVRFLYVGKDNNFINSCDRHIEDKIRYRVFNDNKAYNCIAFWEISAFLNFLCEPYITQGVQYKLVRNVLWSFFSPYRFDPYGISSKIEPLLLKTINIECETDHHYSILSDFCQKRSSSLVLADYFSAMHAYLSLLWIMKEQTIPPLHILPLMTLADDEIYDHISHYLDVNRNFDHIGIDRENAKITDTMHERFNALIANLLSEKIDILTEYKRNKSIVRKMLNIIEIELKNNQRVYRVNEAKSLDISNK